eukprot:1791894-Rhodomonas_salina.1
MRERENSSRGESERLREGGGQESESERALRESGERAREQVSRGERETGPGRLGVRAAREDGGNERLRETLASEALLGRGFPKQFNQCSLNTASLRIPCLGSKGDRSKKGVAAEAEQF